MLAAPVALSPLLAAAIFGSFALAYFLSALIRAVTATLAPTFSAELGLGAGELGLLAGAYFFGFAVMQLPLGHALDRFGARRVLLVFLALAVVGSVAFAMADGFASLLAARTLTGIGVAACLMAPMTAYRLLYSPRAQMRASSWMLMTGSLGMLASTLPVQWLLPQLGWRGLFWAMAIGLAGSMVLIAIVVPGNRAVPMADASRAHGYAAVFRHPTFRRFAPMGFFHYGGMIAMQTLWAGPWLTQVCGWSAPEAARGLFTINLAMLVTFLAWGASVPRLYARGATAQSLIRHGMPCSLVVLVGAVALGPRATAWAWALFCVSSTFVSLSQPAIAQVFPSALAGRALTAYNLVIFAGVFVVQWCLGLVIDLLRHYGASATAAFQSAFGLLAAGCVLSYAWFLWRTDAPMAAGGAALMAERR
jgi:predicted MFS family arabinose efflux permease